VIIGLGISSPFYLKFYTRLELFNEANILVCSYIFLTFTSFVPKPETRYLMGKWLIYFSGFNIVINLTLILLQSLKKMTICLRRLRKKQKAK